MTDAELRAKKCEAQKAWVLKNKEHVSAYRKARREGANRETILAQKRESYRRNKESVLAFQKKYRAENKEAMAVRGREYREKNAETIRLNKAEGYRRNRSRYRETNIKWHAQHPDWRKDYYQKNKAVLSAKKTIWNRKRMAENPSFRAAASMRSRVWSILKHGSIPRTGSIGLRQAALKEWLEAKFEPGMTWENYGRGWHVDHIIPCTAFDLTKPSELRKCFHYHNLRPCWAEENIRKGDKVLTQSELEFAA